MKEVLGVQTQTFTVGDGFLVDIIVDALNEMYEAWIYHRDYGIKELMFGCEWKQNCYKEFFDTVDFAADIIHSLPLSRTMSGSKPRHD